MDPTRPFDIPSRYCSYIIRVTDRQNHTPVGTSALKSSNFAYVDATSVNFADAMLRQLILLTMMPHSSRNGSEEHGSRRATRTHSFRVGHHDRRPIQFAVKREEMPSKTLIPYIYHHFGEDADGKDGWETSRPSDGGAGTG
ncbi:unnamed protein product [Brassica oleracea]|nr:unnamed protein product [Brassica napus]